MKPHRGGLVLTLGILGILVCVICGVIAWVMGNDDLKQMDAGQMDPAGRGITQAGKIIGMVSVILAIVGLVIGVLMIVLAGGLAAAGAAGGGGATGP